MSKTVVFLILFFVAFCPLATFAQSEAVTPRMSFHITKEVENPLLLQIEEQPYFVDADGNDAIDANENCKIVMKVKNVGWSVAHNLSANISATGSDSGIFYSTRKIPDIAIDSVATIEFPLITNMNTVEGNVTFTVFVEGFNGGTDSCYITLQTREFQAPYVEVTDFEVVCKDGKIEKAKEFQLRIAIQNAGQGLAEDISVILEHPIKVFNLQKNKNDVSDSMTISALGANESKILEYSLFVTKEFETKMLTLQVKLKEKYGKYAQDKTINLELNQNVKNYVNVVAKNTPRKTIVTVQLSSDVDKNIPEINMINPHRFAIIIGNQDYHSLQRGLTTEQDVPFAVEDARMFKEYCEKLLGVDSTHIKYLTNATAATMDRGIDLITRVAKRDTQAEILFYYAGHGLPDEQTKEPYLIPVDVNASNLSSAIALYDLYQRLSATNAQRITVFLDACFSGGGRDMGLLASRGVRVTPKKEELTGNLVVFSATSENQTALPYCDKQHGMFTYFLLKKLQESKGACSYAELEYYLEKNVGDYSLLKNSKDQTPEVNTSRQVAETWGSWSFLVK